ncbi:MAG: endonuclease MutS2 [Veillonellales bacterium]
MEQAVFHILEYPKIVAMLAERAGSVMGRELAEELQPVSEIEIVEERLGETAEARTILGGIAAVPLGGIRDVRTSLKRAELGASLEPEELLAIGSTLYAARRIWHFFAELAEPAPRLARIAATITVLRNIENAIDSTISEQGTLRDDASVELLRLRREIRLAQHRVKEKLDSILRSTEYQKYFQEALVTVRGDRYAIPVKQEYRHSFPGIVHDQSASGATVFIEPMAVVNLNNEIKQLMSAEKNEIERILRVISDKIRQVVIPLRENGQAMAQIDFAFAKAKLSFDMNASIPIINREGYVKLIKARHPLISQDKVVPVDIYIGKKFNTLLITGPNTGGKTVTLKTLGLLTLMTQAGLFIPAAAGSEMTVFKEVFADIGDEQSIEQSLSTFSAHMTNLVKILKHVSVHDLVLIDEIGAGTDPDEGAALAMAILEYLLSIEVKTIATTHYSELKTFAYSRPGIENASVEFDIQTLKPTYRLLIGIPGSSNAFAISRRLGLEDSIVQRAKQMISTEHAELETVITNLEIQKKSYLQQQEEVARQQQELKALQEKLTNEQEYLLRNKTEVLAKARREASLLLRQTRRTAEEMIAELKAQSFTQNAQARQRVIQNTRTKLREGLENLTSDDEEDTSQPVALEQAQPGMSVFVTTLQQKGTVLSVGNSDLLVQLGAMKVTVPLTACRLTSRPEQTKAAVKRTEIQFTKINEVNRQIDVRGMTVEEAEEVLGKYLDDVLLAGLHQVLVIHGKGTGALRKGVRSYLKNHHLVRDISIGEVNEGGDGATVVRLS